MVHRQTQACAAQANEVRHAQIAKDDFTDRDIIDFLVNVECLEGNKIQRRQKGPELCGQRLVPAHHLHLSYDPKDLSTYILSGQFDTYGAFGHGFFSNLSMGGEIHRTDACILTLPQRSTCRICHDDRFDTPKQGSMSLAATGPKPRGAKQVANLDMHVRPFVEEIALSEQVRCGHTPLAHLWQSDNELRLLHKRHVLHVGSARELRIAYHQVRNRLLLCRGTRCSRARLAASSPAQPLTLKV